MYCLDGFNGFEVPILGEVGIRTVSRQVEGTSLSRGRVEFFSEEGEQGRPTEFQAVGGEFGGCLGSKEGSESCEVSVKPGLKIKLGGERRRRGNSEVL